MNVDGFAEIEEMVGAIDGWMTPEQGRRLYAAAARCSAGGRIVEIGSFRGKSTVVLVRAADPSVEIVAIDPHAGNDRGPQEIEGFEAEAATDHDVFLANLAAAGVADRVRHVRKFSGDAHEDVAGPIHVLYVDGAHRYGPARTDLKDWGARVAPGGTLLVHDSFSSIGVTGALVRELAASRRFRYVGRSRSLTEFRCTPPLTERQRVANVARLVAQLPWFVKNVALKVALSLGVGRVLARLGRRVPEWPY